jgi:hypothetical protein
VIQGLESPDSPILLHACWVAPHWVGRRVLGQCQYCSSEGAVRPNEGQPSKHAGVLVSLAHRHLRCHRPLHRSDLVAERQRDPHQPRDPLRLVRCHSRTARSPDNWAKTGSHRFCEQDVANSAAVALSEGYATAFGLSALWHSSTERSLETGPLSQSYRSIS